MKRGPTSLHYCNCCRATIRHTETELTSACQRCGTVKHVIRIVKHAAHYQEEYQYQPQ